MDEEGKALYEDRRDVSYEEDEEDNVLSRWTVDDEDEDVSFVIGIQYNPLKNLKIGAVYRQGPEFESEETWADGPFFTGAGYENTRTVKSTLKVPDSYGIGISYQFFDNLTLAFDYMRVEYSDLMEGFEVNVDVGDPEVSPAYYDIDDGDEYHFGAEYLFFMKDIVLAASAGQWYNSDHTLEYDGGKDTQQRFLPSGDDDDNYTFGLGVVLSRLEFDAAANFSDPYDSYSSWAVYRFQAVKKSLESDYPQPEAVAFRPIHGFATAISKTIFRQSLTTLTTPKGRGFPQQTKINLLTEGLSH